MSQRKAHRFLDVTERTARLRFYLALVLSIIGIVRRPVLPLCPVLAACLVLPGSGMRRPVPLPWLVLVPRLILSIIGIVRRPVLPLCPVLVPCLVLPGIGMRRPVPPPCLTSSDS